MKMTFCAISLFLLAVTCGIASATDKIMLPEPDVNIGIPVARAIHDRKSVRSYSPEPLTLKEAGRLLWAAGGATVDGVTGATRAYPSAGGIYPLEIYLVAGDVEGLEPGIYRYEWKDNSLEMVKKADIRSDLSRAAYGQKMLASAPATIVITALYEKTAARYGERGKSLFVPMDAGHLGQNVHLEAQSLGLGTVMVAGFETAKAEKVLAGTEGTPVYMMPVGHVEK
jgi:SagB-type dehydrogenase family enzyme